MRNDVFALIGNKRWKICGHTLLIYHFILYTLLYSICHDNFLNFFWVAYYLVVSLCSCIYLIIMPILSDTVHLSRHPLNPAVVPRMWLPSAIHILDRSLCWHFPHPLRWFLQEGLHKTQAEIRKVWKWLCEKKWTKKGKMIAALIRPNSPMMMYSLCQDAPTSHVCFVMSSPVTTFVIVAWSFVTGIYFKFVLLLYGTLC